MYSVDGIPLQNAAFGWRFHATSKPLLDLSWARQALSRAGRDGVVSIAGAVLEAPTVALAVLTPRRNLEALYALLSSAREVTLTDNPSRVLPVEPLSTVHEAYGHEDRLVRVTVTLRIPGAAWRSIDTRTATAALDSGSVAVGVLGSRAKPGAVPVARNVLANPSFQAGSGTVEVRRNLWVDPAMQTASATTAQGATVTVEAGGKRVVRTGSPGRASTNAAQRVAVTPLAPIAVTARRTVPVAVQGSGATDGRLEVVGYDSTGSHRSNAFQVRVGGAPTVGSEVLSQTITPPDWVTSLEVNFYSGGANGDAIVWTDVGVITPPGPSFGVPSVDPDLTASWTGPVNASPSVLTGVPVAGVTMNRCVAIHSSRFGGSMRLIPTNLTNSDSFAAVSVPASAQSQFTALGAVHMDAPLTGYVHARARRMVAFTPEQPSPQAPNVAGDYPLRLLAAPASILRFYHGGMVGSGDVFWTNGAIVPGDYAGGYFDRTTPATDTLVYAADGTGAAAWSISDWEGGLSLPVADAIIRVRGGVTDLRVEDSSGAWVAFTGTVPAGQWLRIEGRRAWLTTTDTWTGGTDVSGRLRSNGPRRGFEIVPSFTDPSAREGRLTVTTSARTGTPAIEVRARSAHSHSEI